MKDDWRDISEDQETEKWWESIIEECDELIPQEKELSRVLRSFFKKYRKIANKKVTIESRFPGLLQTIKGLSPKNRAKIKRYAAKIIKSEGGL